MTDAELIELLTDLCKQQADIIAEQQNELAQLRAIALEEMTDTEE